MYEGFETLNGPSCLFSLFLNDGPAVAFSFYEKMYSALLLCRMSSRFAWQIPFDVC